eukprot:scaffold656846_cov42-Prasinocladus_malaysianus.AAC.1
MHAICNNPCQLLQRGMASSALYHIIAGPHTLTDELHVGRCRCGRPGADIPRQPVVMAAREAWRFRRRGGFAARQSANPIAHPVGMAAAHVSALPFGMWFGVALCGLSA